MQKRFVIQIHSGFGPIHYDLMLESRETLATWKLSEALVALAQQGEIPARKLPDHRTAYLDYEGPVSGNRGQVNIYDKGTYALLDQTNSQWEVQLNGEKVSGRFVLELKDAAEGIWSFSALSSE